jgi:hypothetical protein
MQVRKVGGPAHRRKGTPQSRRPAGAAGGAGQCIIQLGGDASGTHPCTLQVGVVCSRVPRVFRHTGTAEFDLRIFHFRVRPQLPRHQHRRGGGIGRELGP